MKYKINLRDLKKHKLRFKRIRYRTLLIGAGIIATALIAFNFWFVDHAKETIEYIVSNQSKGMLKLKMEKFKFNWITNNIEIEKALFYTTDTAAATHTQLISEKISIKAKGFLPMLIRTQIIIDSIHLYSPKVVITKIKQSLKKNELTTDSPAYNTFSVPKEMGRISKSITDAINALKINRFQIEDGSFILVDKTNPNENPVLIDKIHIRLDNLQVDSTTLRSKESQRKILFTDEIAMQTHDQNISFPGQRHFLSFKNFRLTLRNKRVEFDSCTIKGIKGDSSKTNFKIFFDKLQLTNINFDTLYHAEVIKADSVFCTNPYIYFDIDSDQKSNTKNKIQNIDALVQQLIGDVMLNYVVVKNADIDINTIKKGKTNSFEAKNTNIELQGLVIRQNYERPIRLNKFILGMHNYENVLKSGRYAIAFDSVLFQDDAINLTKFLFKEINSGQVSNEVIIPGFILRGLSWESLLYDNIFNARDASLYQPVINYYVPAHAKKSKDIFQTLSGIGNLMNLTKLNIVNGRISVHMGKNVRLLLNNTDLSLSADELTASKKIKNIQNAIKYMYVSKGKFTKAGMNITLDNINFIENNTGLSASSIVLNDEGLKAKANNVRFNSVILDSSNHTISVNGLKWANADIYINNIPKRKTQKSALLLENIKGNNTNIRINQGGSYISAFLDKILVEEFKKTITGQPLIMGLKVTGKEIVYKAPEKELNVASFDITDHNNSLIRNISFKKIDEKDSIVIKVPSIIVIPDISKITADRITVDNIIFNEPFVYAKLGRKDAKDLKKQKTAPAIQLETALLRKPNVSLTLVNKSNLPSYVLWNGVQENSFLKLSNFISTYSIPLKADALQIYLTNFEYINTVKKRIATNDNKLNLQFDNLLVQKNDSDKIEWQTSANIFSIDKLFFDSLGKKNMMIKLNKGDVRNIYLNSRFINSIGDIIKNSENLRISGTDGILTSIKNQVDWYNLKWDKGYFHIDSLNFAPLQSIEDYKIKKSFNEDYLKVHTGVVEGGPMSLIKLTNDSILNIGNLQAYDVMLLSFKDKRQEDSVKKEKLLPAKQILRIPLKLGIKSATIKNMYTEYWEINPKTDTLAIIPVSEMNVQLKNIKNYNIQPGDTLYIDASGSVFNMLQTRLIVNESYQDSLNSFLMKLQTGPLELKKLNHIILPLIATKVVRGDLDSIYLQAIGNNDYSFGEMNMYYKNLKLLLLNKKDLNKQSVLNKFISWAANVFIIRKNNYGKESPAFFERLKEKSAINFLIKTTLSGVKSSIGLPGIKGKQKQYFRRLKKVQSGH